MGRMSHENQQHEHDCNSEYMVVVSSKHNCHNTSYHSFSLPVVLNVTRKAAIYLRDDVIADSFGGW